MKTLDKPVVFGTEDLLMTLCNSVTRVLTVATLLALAMLSWYEYREIIKTDLARAELEARVLEDHATRSFDSASALMASMAGGLDPVSLRGEHDKTDARLAQAIAALPFIRSISVVTTDGVVLSSSDPAHAGMRIDTARFGPAPSPGKDLLGPYTHGRDLSVYSVTGKKAAINPAIGFIPLVLAHARAYLRWADDDIAEPDFFNQLTQRTGCGLLLDVNNLVVNALNQQRAAEGGSRRDEAAAVQVACNWVDTIHPSSVGEIHLAGYHDTGELVIDDHGSRVHAPVWQVFGHAIRRLGARPVLVEWDTALPELPVLLGEAAKAEALMARAEALMAQTEAPMARAAP